MARLSTGVICDAVEVFSGNVTANAALLHFHAGYNRVLAGGDPRDSGGAPHLWSFLQLRAELSLAMSITGTATGVYAAGTETTTITATTAIFDPIQVGDSITIDTVTDPLVIASYTSSTVIVAALGEDFAGKAVSLPHHGIYALPAGFDGFLEPPVYALAAGLATPDLEEVSPERLFEMRRESNALGTPRYYALVADAAAAAGTAQTYSLAVAPRPEATRLLLYRYRLAAPDLTDLTTMYPLGPPSMSPLYRAAALADAELLLGHVPGPHEAAYQKLMITALDADGAMFATSEPLRMASSEG
ncbi:MAG TPA: hypothetical protein VMY35_07685 [Phycisphaerae bacterium]|nr:hypothetical protein [Phycisphaerae bacterium]